VLGRVLCASGSLVSVKRLSPCRVALGRPVNTADDCRDAVVKHIYVTSSVGEIVRLVLGPAIRAVLPRMHGICQS